MSILKQLRTTPHYSSEASLVMLRSAHAIERLAGLLRRRTHQIITAASDVARLTDDLSEVRAENDSLRETNAEASAVCLCGCAMADHADCAGGGIVCGAEDHECLLVSAVVLTAVEAERDARRRELRRKEREFRTSCERVEDELADSEAALASAQDTLMEVRRAVAHATEVTDTGTIVPAVRSPLGLRLLAILRRARP